MNILNVFPNVKQIRLKHSRNVIISNLNINPFPNEFDRLKLLLNSTPDTLVLTVTKLDDYFPSSQFYIDGYSMSYKLDIYCNGRGAWLLAGTYYSPAKNVRYFFITLIKLWIITAAMSKLFLAQILIQRYLKTVLIHLGINIKSRDFFKNNLFLIACKTMLY